MLCIFSSLEADPSWTSCCQQMQPLFALKLCRVNLKKKQFSFTGPNASCVISKCTQRSVEISCYPKSDSGQVICMHKRKLCTETYGLCCELYKTRWKSLLYRINFQSPELSIHSGCHPCRSQNDHDIMSLLSDSSGVTNRVTLSLICIASNYNNSFDGFVRLKLGGGGVL